MKRFPRAIPRNKNEALPDGRRLFGWKRVAKICLLGLVLGLGVYVMFFYRIKDVKVKYSEETGRECLGEDQIVKLVMEASLLALASNNYLQSNLSSKFSCIESLRLSWRGVSGVDVTVKTTEPIIAVIKQITKDGSLMSSQSEGVEDTGVFYVNKYGDIVRFEAAIGLPRVYLKVNDEKSGDSEKFLETHTLARLLQLYDYFVKETGFAPRIEVTKIGHAKVSTAEISNLLIDLNGDLENQLQRYEYIVKYLKDRNQQIMQIDVRYNWNYVKSQD